MMNFARYWAVSLVLIPGLVPAQTSSLSGTGVLTLECVAMTDGEPVYREDGSLLAYSGRFRSTYVRYDLIELQELDAATLEDCSGRYDTRTRMLTDLVRSRDATFLITLEHRSDTTFYIESFDFQGPATTSIWRISNGDSEILLAGSINLLAAKGLNTYPLGFEYAFQDADLLLIDQDNVSAPFAPNPQEYLDSAQRSDGSELADGLASGTFNQLDVYLEDIGIEYLFIADWSAGFVSNLLYHFSLFEAGFSSPGPVVHYGQRGLVQGKPVWYLETMAATYDLIDERYALVNEDLLLQARFESMSSGQLIADHAADIDAWQSGSEDHIYTADFLATPGNDETRFRKQVAEQNQRWLPRILPYFENPELTLVLVSAINLTGPDGLLQLFRDRGFTVSYFR